MPNTITIEIQYAGLAEQPGAQHAELQREHRDHRQHGGQRVTEPVTRLLRPGPDLAQTRQDGVDGVVGEQPAQRDHDEEQQLLDRNAGGQLEAA